ncbi:MAG: preprotein translocase subunit SecA [Chloroflexi bacterium]|nr:preprotein translocase subunit SecA [Chloroflexota bacterium]
MFGILNKIVGDSNEKAVKGLQPIVDEINSLEDEMKSLSDEELRNLTTEFRSRLEAGESLDDLLPEAFAAVREASRRTLGMRHFDVQLVGGIVLHQGKIAEMRTGEGKTLVATLPTYLNALTGDGVHVVTVNDYLAERDASWMGAIYHALGLTVGCLQTGASFVYDPERADAQRKERAEADGETAGKTPEQEHTDGSMAFADVAGEHMFETTKRETYAADIVYATNNELGFDYLRDNMVDSKERMVQRGLAYAVVDEVDNILIDEARTPLIISGPAHESGQEYRRFSQLARQLRRDRDFEIDDAKRTIAMTEEGIERVEKALGVENLYAPENQVLSHFVENAIRAEVMYLRDVQYVNRGGEIVIVDEFTGRLMEGRRYSDGLHQAIEAKEGVDVQRESVTYATITLQNYFRMYKKLSGMTGTAATEAEEFFKIYKLEVVTVPTNKETAREDRPDQIYMNESAKWRAVAGKIEELTHEGRPVLVGTTSIEKSEQLADMLRQRNLRFNVLNAKQHEHEAEVIAQAGRPGAITVSTNMAGRGTDIILGGNPEALDLTPGQWKEDHERVVKSGGLFVLGTERHESRRIDNQLRGRAGRQGDPGATQFYLSTEDDIIKWFGGDRIRGIMSMFKWDEDEAIQNKMISRTVESAQSKVEGQHFEVRKTLVDYDDVVNTQRDIIYRLRQQILDGEGLRETITGYVERELTAVARQYLTGAPENWDVQGFQRELTNIFPVREIFADEDEVYEFDTDEVVDRLIEYAGQVYDKREQEFGEDMMRRLERAIMLKAVDGMWVEHLTTMDGMRQGIGLEAAGQRDPLVQYKRQGFEMFQDLITRIESNIARTIFRVALSNQPAPAQPRNITTAKPQPASVSNGSGDDGARRRAASVAGQKSVMANVERGHGAEKLTVPTHTPDGRKLSRQERRKFERAAQKQAKSRS